MQGLSNLSLEPAYIAAAMFYYSEKITRPAQIQGEKKCSLLMGWAAKNCGCFSNPPRQAFGSFQFSAKMTNPAVNILVHFFQ